MDAYFNNDCGVYNGTLTGASINECYDYYDKLDGKLVKFSEKYGDYYSKDTVKILSRNHTVPCPGPNYGDALVNACHRPF